MSRRRHNEMDLLSPEDVERIYRVTDELDLHRDWVVVPLNAADEGLELVMPDGKLLLRGPAAPRFEPWLAGLKDRLQDLNLSQTPRRSEVDPKRPLTGMWGPRFSGTMRYLPPRLRGGAD